MQLSYVPGDSSQEAKRVVVVVCVDGRQQGDQSPTTDCDNIGQHALGAGVEVLIT